MLVSFLNNQQAQTNQPSVEIEGMVSHIEKAADDISFYTWTLYVTIDVQQDWMAKMRRNNCSLDSIQLRERSEMLFGPGKLQFKQGGFYDEKAINRFLGKVRVGKKVRVVVLEEWLHKFLGGFGSRLYLESIEVARH